MKVARIYVFGDSLVAGTYDSQGGWCDRLKRDMHRITTGSNDGSKRQLYNLGVGGETSRGLASRIKAELSARHRLDWPAIIIIGVGKNDSRLKDGEPSVPIEEYERNLEAILGITREVTDKIIIVGIGPCAEEKVQFKEYSYTRNNLSRYEATLTQVAMRAEVTKISVYDKLLAANPNRVFYRDKLHLSDAGYEIIYESVKPVLLELLSQA